MGYYIDMMRRSIENYEVHMKKSDMIAQRKRWRICSSRTTLNIYKSDEYADTSWCIGTKGKVRMRSGKHSGNSIVGTVNLNNGRDPLYNIDKCPYVVPFMKKYNEENSEYFSLPSNDFIPLKKKDEVWL